jgi:hypothetical protein
MSTLTGPGQVRGSNSPEALLRARLGLARFEGGTSYSTGRSSPERSRLGPGSNACSAPSGAAADMRGHAAR